MSTETNAGAQGGAPAVPIQPQFHGSSTGGPIGPPPGAAPPAGATGTTGAPAAAGAEGSGGEPGRRVLVTDLPEGALLERINSARDAAARKAREETLRELGIADPAAFKTENEARAKKLAELEAAEEKRKRESMTREQQLAADLEAEKKRATLLETEMRELRETSVSSSQEQVVERASRKHIDPEMYAYARIEFINHVNELAKTNPKELEALDERATEKFFRELAKRKPRLALDTTPAPKDKDAPAGKPPVAAPPARPVVRQPLSTGPAPRVGAPPPVPKTGKPDVVNGKTPRPGQPNSMSRQELKQHLAAQGLKGW